MYRRPSLAEARYTLGDPSIWEEKGVFWREFSRDLRISFPTSIPLDQDHNLVWPSHTLDSQTEPKLSECLKLYPGAETVIVTSGSFDGQNFHLTTPRDCEHVMLRVTLLSSIISAYQTLDGEFAQRYGALWYYADPGGYELDKFYNATDFWILPTPETLRPLLNQQADKFSEDMRAADEIWSNYARNKHEIRHQIEAEISPFLESGEWGWFPHEDEATLYYLGADGDGEVLELMYTDAALSRIRHLVQVAKKS